jgi:hypothetical protein
LELAIVLAVLDFSIELGDKEDIDETLEEANIVPDLVSIYPNLDKVLDTVEPNVPVNKRYFSTQTFRNNQKC